MAEQVYTIVQDGVGVITLNRPPANVLTPELRLVLDQQLDQAMANPDVIGIVLTGAGGSFCVGVDISEYNGPFGHPWVSELCNKIENSPKPIVAAMHASAIGAGLELALAAHARVARADTRLAMPDIKLGMIPGAGATQRLPRILGAQRALEILLSGQVIRASDPRVARLITQLTQTSPVDGACELALKLAHSGQWKVARDECPGFSDPVSYQASVNGVKAQMSERSDAAGDILRCVESAQLLPLAQGLAFERALFDDRLASPEARCARHYMMAEKFAASPPRFDGAKGAPIRQIALLGTRDRLGELAVLLLNAGFGVKITCTEAPDAQAFDAWIARVLQNLVKQGKWSEAQFAQRMTLFECSTNFANLAQGDLIIDDGSTPPGQAFDLRGDAIWCVLEPETTAKTRAGDLGINKPAIGLHPYQPMSERQIVELSYPALHGASDVAAVMGVVRRLGKSAILTPLQAGSIRGVLASAFYGAAMQLLHHGVSPYAVDAAAREIGFTAGPFALMDRAGLPQVQTRLEGYASQHAFAASPDTVLAHLVKDGRVGRSSGQGFYNHVDGQLHEDPALAQYLPLPNQSQAGPNMSARMIGSALLGALVNEAARLLEGKHIRRASDIDLILVKGFGYSSAMGGPLLQVDMSGLFYLFKDMQKLTQLSPIWAPHDKISDMVKQGNGFFGRSVG